MDPTCGSDVIFVNFGKLRSSHQKVAILNVYLILPNQFTGNF